MVDADIHFNPRVMTVNGSQVEVTCGPVRVEPLNEFEGAMVQRRKVVGSAENLPSVIGNVAILDGAEWTVEKSTAVEGTVVVTLIRYLA